MYKHLFIAIKIYPTDVLLAKVAFLKDHLNQDLINWIPEDHYHITLRFLGKTSLKHIPKIEAVLQKIASQQSGFSLQINAVRIFGSAYKPMVLWLGIEEQQGFLDLHKKMEEALKHIGYHSDRQNFIPHISIARIKKVRDKKFFQMLLNRVDNAPIQTQHIGEVILYESILGVKGVTYNIVKSFKLGT